MTIVNDPNDANIIIVNTCSFLESARLESIENILEFCTLKKEGRIKKVVVTGCLAERYKEEIAKVYPTPFHLYDEAGIRKNAENLKKAFAWNKGFREYFAVKATPNPFLIDILREFGCGCDCSSITELMLSKAIGAVGDDIMFSSNDTPPAEFKYADDLGAIINLDDITHIDILEKTLGNHIINWRDTVFFGKCVN